VRTGGFSSASSPLVGFALRFAQTPPLPPPYTRPLVGACVLNVGSSVTLRWMPCAIGSTSSDGGFPRISRCRSSRPSPSSSSSESESNVSASVRSSSWVRGSADRSRRDAWSAGEGDLEWKDGGGDAGGHCCAPSEVNGESSASCAATCGRVLVESLSSPCGQGMRAHSGSDGLRRTRS
jgi:hypothetical protein